MSPASFSNHSTSDNHPNSSRGLGDRIAKFKSLSRPSFPLAQPSAASPSSWFAIPPGLSPAGLLDSPIIISDSGVFPSPTTGSLPYHGFGWNNTSDYGNQHQGHEDIKSEQNDFTEFYFQTQKPLTYYDLGEEIWEYEEAANHEVQSSSLEMKSEVNQLQSYSPEIAAIQRNDQSSNNTAQTEYNHYNQSSSQTVSNNTTSDDGYNWRKYGQKQVKGSENPRSYYKCTFANCDVKKLVERSIDGPITEIVYKGSHNHPKPQSTQRSSSSSAALDTHHSYSAAYNEIVPENSFGQDKVDSSGGSPENSTTSVGDDELEQSSQRTSRSTADEIDKDEPQAKRWKGETESAGVSAVGSRAVREPKVVVQTTSDIDILDDGYRWRKYGQKVVKGNPNPRSYYRCTAPDCPVTKQVERACNDPRSVITSYDGKHNHDIPAARGSGNGRVSNPIRPTTQFTNHSTYPIPTQPSYGAGMLQNPGSFGYSCFGNLMNEENAPFSVAKDEPEYDLFIEPPLY